MKPIVKFIHWSVMNADKKQHEGGFFWEGSKLKTAFPCAQFIDLDTQQATGGCRQNKNMKPLKPALLDHTVFLPKCTESHHRLKAEHFNKTKSKLSNQPVPDLRSRQPVNRKPSITANPMLNSSLPSFDVGQHTSWCGVSVAQCNFTVTMGK